jgi:hypothetical protein
MEYFTIAAGCLLLIFGLRLFWLFAGIAGFLIGFGWAEVFGAGPLWAHALAGAGLGLLGTLAAFILGKTALAVAGFLSGFYLAMSFATVVPHPVSIALMAATGFLGAWFALAVGDWAIMFLSSVTGASLIASAAGFGFGIGTVFYLLLVFSGMVIQDELRNRHREPVSQERH